MLNHNFYMSKSFNKGDYYHIFNKSIQNYRIFSSYSDAKRFILTLSYYNNIKLIHSLSRHFQLKKPCIQNPLLWREEQKVSFICYCLMPDHYHLLIKMIHDNFVSKYVNDIENSYSRYFNLKHSRKGPLWQSSFKSVKIKSSEQLLHVSRYIHLNPTTDSLVQKPENWPFSSYRDYIDSTKGYIKIRKELTGMSGLKYRLFVEDQIDYQKKLKSIKKLVFY